MRSMAMLAVGGGEQKASALRSAGTHAMVSPGGADGYCLDATLTMKRVRINAPHVISITSPAA